MSKNLRELEQQQQSLEYQNKVLRVFIADVLPFEEKNSMDMEARMMEVENLVNTYWWVVILKHIQKRWVPDYKNYIWSWKIDEIMEQMQQEKADILILGNILKPIQIYNINEKLKTIWAKAWDRIDLILKIFERNAKTMESKLQIELASIKHMWPRIFGMSEELWSQWSWWSKLSRWKWETNTEIMKRHLKEREQFIKKELEHYKKVRAEHRKSRQKKWLNTVWIVGYTNAGKSSLMNFLTQKWVLAEDKLFATLGTSVWKMYVEHSYWENGEFIKSKEILINDTIGFIRDLPPNLIQAFASTLEDSIESDILLHVVDASDPKMKDKINIVSRILDQIWAHQKQIYVFNKVDLLSDDEKQDLLQRYADFSPLLVSTYSSEWIWELKQTLLWEFR